MNKPLVIETENEIIIDGDADGEFMREVMEWAKDRNKCITVNGGLTISCGGFMKSPLGIITHPSRWQRFKGWLRRR